MPNVLVVRPGLQASSVQELIALAKSQPGKLAYGSPGRGSLLHLAMEMLKAHADIDIVHVPYRGGEFVKDMLGGRIDLAFVTLSGASELHESGQLRALSVASAKRSALLSNVPALSESIPGSPRLPGSRWQLRRRHRLRLPRNCPPAYAPP